MNDFIQEFQALSATYRRIEEGLDRIAIGDSPDSGDLNKANLQIRDCLARIEDEAPRLNRLAEAWALRRDTMHRASQQEIVGGAEALLAHAVRLQEICTLQAQKIQMLRDRLGRDLAEAARGSLYLQSLKPPKNNYPKFVDSHC